jgi:hypothetical protein
MTENILAKTGDILDDIELGCASRTHVLEAMAYVQQARAAVQSLAQRFEAACIQWIDTNGGELIDGDKRYYVGVDKKHKCKDVRATLEALLVETGGDLDALNTCLSSGAFKPATTMTTLGDKAAEFFETQITQDLKTGKPKRALKSANMETDE